MDMNGPLPDVVLQIGVCTNICLSKNISKEFPLDIYIDDSDEFKKFFKDKCFG